MLINIFSKTNEECLNNPEFSRALTNGDSYSINMGSNMRQVLYYPEGNAFSVTRDVSMDLLYRPSMSEDSPNAIRFDIKEKLGEEDYPYINFSIDILDTGEIVYNETYEVEKDSKPMPTSNKSHLKVSEEGLGHVRDIFMDIFVKSNIKEVGIKK
jgi:hypothetical protein